MPRRPVVPGRLWRLQLLPAWSCRPRGTRQRQEAYVRSKHKLRRLVEFGIPADQGCRLRREMGFNVGHIGRMGPRRSPIQRRDFCRTDCSLQSCSVQADYRGRTDIRDLLQDLSICGHELLAGRVRDKRDRAQKMVFMEQRRGYCRECADLRCFRVPLVVVEQHGRASFDRARTRRLAGRGTGITGAGRYRVSDRHQHRMLIVPQTHPPTACAEQNHRFGKHARQHLLRITPRLAVAWRG